MMPIQRVNLLRNESKGILQIGIYGKTMLCFIYPVISKNGTDSDYLLSVHNFISFLDRILHTMLFNENIDLIFIADELGKT